MTPFEELKAICQEACYERQACRKGYRQLMEAHTIEGIMAAWRDNWNDLVNSKFADIVAQRLPAIYPSIKQHMNLAGIYYNECPETANNTVRVLIGETSEPVRIYGMAHANVLGAAHVYAYGHSQVINHRADGAVVSTFDYAYASVTAGRLKAYDRSNVDTCCPDAELHGHVTCLARGGVVKAYTFVRVNVVGADTTLYASRSTGIESDGKAKIIYNL